MTSLVATKATFYQLLLERLREKPITNKTEADLLLNYSKLNELANLSLTNCVHVSQPLTRQDLSIPHIYVTCFPSCLQVLVSPTPWSRRLLLKPLSSPMLQFLQDWQQYLHPKQPSPTNPTSPGKSPSPTLHYVYSTFSIIFGLKELAFITITLNSFQCYTANFIIQPRIS